MRYTFLIVSLAILLLCFAADGGKLRVLYQPIEFIGVFVVAPMLLSAKNGFRRTMGGLCLGSESQEFVRDGLWVAGGLGTFILIGNGLMALQNLTDMEKVGHFVSAGLVGLLYALGLFFFVLLIKSESREESAR